MKVLVKTPISQYSGYGNDGIGLIRALMRWGCDVYVDPVYVSIPVPPDILPLFTKLLEAPFDLSINHWDPRNLSISESARRATRLAVAWTMWEFAGSAANPGAGLLGFKNTMRSSLRKRLKWYDLVLGYDNVSLAAIEPYISRHTGTGVLQGGYEAGDWRPVERDWHDERFGFIMHGALNSRKQPFLAVQAFNELKWEHPEEFKDATLSLHTTHPSLLPEMNEIMMGQKIRVFYEMFSEPVLQQFYQANHCLLAPSRGEGKNLPALEFMGTGGAVVATNFGGHTQWLNEEYAYGLPYDLKPTFPELPDGPHDARVSMENSQGCHLACFHPPR